MKSTTEANAKPRLHARLDDVAKFDARRRKLAQTASLTSKQPRRVPAKRNQLAPNCQAFSGRNISNSKCLFASYLDLKPSTEAKARPRLHARLDDVAKFDARRRKLAQTASLPSKQPRRVPAKRNQLAPNCQAFSGRNISNSKCLFASYLDVKPSTEAIARPRLHG